MCPSFMATGEELHSTRGRAHLLWELMQGEVLPDQWKNEQVKESLDLCLACKACKSECPVSVDMATYKAEFLSHHFENESRPLSHYAFGRIDLFARIAGFAPNLVNAINNAPIINKLIKRALHIHPNRTFPRFANPSRPIAASQKTPAAATTAEPGRTLPALYSLLPTPYSLEYPRSFSGPTPSITTSTPPPCAPPTKSSPPPAFASPSPPNISAAAAQLYDFGMLDTAKDYLLKTLNALTPQLQNGTPIVALEPSCASVFRDELTNLLPHDPRAAKLRDQTFLLSEFLVKHAPNYRPPQIDQKIIVHGHCHHRATMGMHDEIALLRLTGAEVELLDSGCCGMAGPFGFEEEKFDLSQKLGERILLPAVRNNANAIIVSDGFSCCEQITQNTTAKPRHLAEVLAQWAQP